MKNSLHLLCRHRWTSALITGLGIGWAMAAAINPGVGIAIGAAVAFSLMPRAARN